MKTKAAIKGVTIIDLSKQMVNEPEELELLDKSKRSKKIGFNPRF